ncbi:phage tail tape measure protein [Cohaesibacter haloalkalitolerans]|uniref:phage tail tape measure protein n=1 Tax=Cohaesibacter haloalkalitolerans TaxID=1162980 RepID=UPI000E648C99|nr:phage tail tape measure protein [Cohaesibacter haloalkalitolerans]
MAEKDLEKLVLRIEANTTQFNKALKKIEKNTETSLGKSEKSVVKFTSSLGSLGKAAKGAVTAVGGFAGIAVGGGLAGIAALAKTSAEQVADLATEAKRAGVSFEAFQELDYAARKSNVSIDALTDGLKELQLRADEFITTGSGGGADAFKRLGYSADDLKNRLKEPDKLFDDIIGRLQQFDKAAQIRIADEVFGGTGGEQFVQMIERGQKGLRDAREEARRLGIVLDETVARQAQQINQEFETLSTTIGTKVKGAVVTVTAALLQLKNSFDDSVLGDSAGGQVDTVFRLADRYREAKDQLEKARGALDTSRRNAGSTGNTFEASLVEEVKKAEDQIRKYSELIARADYDLGGGAISVAGLDIKSKQREMGLIPPASPMIPKPAPGSPSTKPDKGDDKKTRTEQVDKVHEVILALEQEAAQLGRTSGEQELYNALAKAGVNLESDQGQAIAAAVNGLQAKRLAMQEAASTAKAMQMQTQELTQNFEYLGQSGVDMLTDIVSGASSAEDAMRSFALQIANAAAQAALFGTGPMASIMTALTGSSGGALTGLFTSLAGSITSSRAALDLSSFVTGARAGGGIVLPGNLYQVNENGPELFSPNVAGRIEPYQPFGSVSGNASRAGDTHNWYVSTPDVQGFKQSQGQIAANMARLVARGGRNQ